MRLFSLSTNAKGITLIELLVVVAIIGILAGGLIALLNPLEQLDKAQDARRKSDLSNIQKAIELYYQDNGTFPVSTADFKIRNGTTTVEWGSSGFRPYMESIPKDSGASYAYHSRNNGGEYFLFASLARGSQDPQACGTTEPARCAAATSYNVTCGTGVCNYVVSSPECDGELASLEVRSKK